MDNADLEIGDVDVIEQNVRSLIDVAREANYTYRFSAINEANHTNRFSSRMSMVPSGLRDLRPSSFYPRLLSIGPLHKRDLNVQALEGEKPSYLFSLLNRINSPQEEILKSCMKKAYNSLNKIKDCYVSTGEYSDDEIPKMMVMDACFILEFICRQHDNESYAGNMLLVQTMIHDMVLLENQIPFFFLEKIFQGTILKFYPDTSLVEFIYPVLSFINLFEANIEIPKFSNGSIHHILSLLHECYKPRYSMKSNFSLKRTHSATELDMAGVNFKPYSNPKWLLGMEMKRQRFSIIAWFLGKRTLRVPVLTLNRFTELVFRNLIAYEQSCETSLYITSYATAMDMLVNTQEDIAKLVDSRVLVNNMNSNKEAADMINYLCEDVGWVHFFYNEEWKILDTCCNEYWPKQLALLWSIYFNNPWTFIAFLAGIFLFVLTALQTGFTIKSAI